MRANVWSAAAEPASEEDVDDDVVELLDELDEGLARLAGKIQLLIDRYRFALICSHERLDQLN